MYGTTPHQNTKKMKYFEKTPSYIIIRVKLKFGNFFFINFFIIVKVLTFCSGALGPNPAFKTGQFFLLPINGFSGILTWYILMLFPANSRKITAYGFFMLT